MLPIVIENPTEFNAVGKSVAAHLLRCISEVINTGHYPVSGGSCNAHPDSIAFLKKLNKKAVIEKLVMIPPEKLENHVQWFKKMQFSSDVIKDIKGIFVDLVYSKSPRTALIESVGLKTCPYCNRAYIYTIKNGNINPQLDHFYPKARYPLFAVSLYNLIPSCAVCNSAGAKGSKDTLSQYPIISPYLVKHDDFRFAYTLLSPGIVKGEKYEKSVVNVFFKKCANTHNDSVFHLRSLYRIHGDHVADLLYKRKYVYTDAYIDNLSKIIGWAVNRSTINRFIVGTYVEKENYHKRPLSKLYTEIAEDIGLLK